MLKNDTLIGKSALDLFLFSTEGQGPYPLLRQLDFSNNVSIFFPHQTILPERGILLERRLK